MYDHKIDGAGNFKPEDVLVPGSGFIVGRVGDQAVACGALPAARAGSGRDQADVRGARASGREVSKADALDARAHGAREWLQDGAARNPWQQAAAIALYEGLGYVRIPNYGMYEGREDCLCYEKALSEAEAGHRVSARE